MNPNKRSSLIAVLSVGAALLSNGCAPEDATDDAELLDTEAEESDEVIGSTSQALTSTDVGVIKEAGAACPGEIDWYFDDENDNNQNRYSGWIGATSSGANTTIRFCRVQGSRFTQIPSSYSYHNFAVLKLGSTCPAGSMEFSRYWDNEDDGSSNQPSLVDTGGNTSTAKNVNLHFCMFRASAGAGSG
jgi:hypothetical protein